MNGYGLAAAAASPGFLNGSANSAYASEWPWPNGGGVGKGCGWVVGEVGKGRGGLGLTFALPTFNHTHTQTLFHPCDNNAGGWQVYWH